MEQQVICRIHNGVGRITLDRPKALNSLSLPMIEEIRKHLRDWQKDESVVWIYLEGAGEKGLCAGGDVRAFYEHKGPDAVALAERFFPLEYEVDLMIHRYPKPVVAYMDGIVMGGGVGLSIGASERIVTEKTRFAMPEMNIGFFPDVGGSYFLSRMPGCSGRYLALTSDMIEAADVLYAGAADRYVNSGRWDEAKSSLLDRDWTEMKGSDHVTAALSEVLDSFTEKDAPVESRLELWQERMDNHFSYRDVESIIQSLQESAQSGDDWAAKTLGVLKTKSPTSLKVALRQVIEGKTKTLEECFQMELRLALNFVRYSHDFYEGVRAVLVDKDRNPQWKPATLEEVTEKEVGMYFV